MMSDETATVEASARPLRLNTTVFVCSDERSGSHLLCDHMASTGLLGRPSEYFNTVGMRFFSPNYPEDVKEQSLLAESLGTTPNGVFAFNAHTWTMDRILPIIDIEFWQKRFYVYLVRSDVLGQAISLLKAKQTNIWASDRESQSTRVAPSYKASEIDAIIKELLVRRSRWETFFARNGIKPLRLAYETVVSDPAMVVAEIGEHIGLQETVRLNVAGEPKLRKQADETNDRWRSQFILESSNLRSFSGGAVKGPNVAHAQMQASTSKEAVEKPKAGLTREELRTYWEEPRNYDGAWEERGRVATRGLPESAKWFVDIGCGPKMALRTCLPSECVYIPMDMKRWNADVVICDLNEQIPPQPILSSDVSFMLGVLEYVYDIGALLRKVAFYSNNLVISYCTNDISKDRLAIWVNNYSSADLESMISEAGFDILRKEPYKPGQFVFQMKNRNSIDKSRTDFARRQHLQAGSAK